MAPIGGPRSGIVGSGVAIPGNVVDNFESADSEPFGIYESGQSISDYYKLDTADYSRTQTDAIEGSFALNYSGAATTRLLSEPGDGLNRYPQKGDVVSCLMRDLDNQVPSFLLGGGLTNSSLDSYYFQIGDVNRLRIGRFDEGSNNTLANNDSVTIDQGEWYDCEVEWHDGTGSEPDNTFVFTVYTIDTGDLSRTGTAGTLSVSDATHASNRGSGFANQATAGVGGTYFDFLRVTGSV